MLPKKEYLSFKEFVPEIKITLENLKSIHLSEYVFKRFRKYKQKNELRSDSHAIYSLIVLNEMLLSIMQKVDSAIKAAKKAENPDYFIAVFQQSASPKERAMWDLIWRGILY